MDQDLYPKHGAEALDSEGIYQRAFGDPKYDDKYQVLEPGIKAVNYLGNTEMIDAGTIIKFGRVENEWGEVAGRPKGTIKVVSITIDDAVPTKQNYNIRVSFPKDSLEKAAALYNIPVQKEYPDDPRGSALINVPEMVARPYLNGYLPLTKVKEGESMEYESPSSDDEGFGAGGDLTGQESRHLTPVSAREFHTWLEQREAAAEGGAAAAAEGRAAAAAAAEGGAEQQSYLNSLWQSLGPRGQQALMVAVFGAAVYSGMAGGGDTNKKKNKTKKKTKRRRSKRRKSKKRHRSR